MNHRPLETVPGNDPFSAVQAGGAGDWIPVRDMLDADDEKTGPPPIPRHCQACMSGEQHPSHVLYGRLKGRRVAVYVPEELVPEVQRSLDNGRALQELLQQAAPRYIKALKRERTKALKTEKS